MKKQYTIKISVPLYKGAKWVGDHYGASPSALRSWANNGILRCIRTPGSGKRLYDVNQLDELMGHSSARATTSCSIIYARVSSSKQRSDLQRQVRELQQAYPNHRVITDIASGINFKRPGLRALLDAVHRRGVSQVVVMHRDRLARFAIDLLEYIFRQQSVKLVVHRQCQAGAESTQQLAEDLMAITTVFVASHHGKRAAEGRRRRKRQKEEEAQARQVQDEENVQAPQDPEDQGLPE